MNDEFKELYQDKFSLSYGQLINILTSLGMGKRKSIEARFRALRIKFEDDFLISKPGIRISYDLSRVLSICSIFSLNSIGIPQGDAVNIIISNWPEIARACIAANRAVDGSTAEADPSMGECMRLYINAFPSAYPKLISWASFDPLPMRHASHIVLDFEPIVGTLRQAVPTLAEQLSVAMGEIERSFGWQNLAQGAAPRFPDRVESGFFGTGPYFERARALIDAGDGKNLDRSEIARLQAYLDYVETPPPIDSWKKYIGTEPTEFRLGHLLGAKGVELGLKSNLMAIDTMLNAASESGSRALALVEAGERSLAQCLTRN